MLPLFATQTYRVGCECGGLPPTASGAADSGSVAGQDGGGAGPADAGADAGDDAGTGADAGDDAGTGADAGGDAGVGADAGGDAGTDAGADAGSDAGSDAGTDSGTNAGPPLSLAPASVTVAVADTVTFVASGGLLPYTFDLASNGSGASVGALTGLYTAGTTGGGASDVVRVTDGLGATATANLTVNWGLSILPASVALAVTNTRAFAADGGVGPYTFGFVTNNSGGSLAPGSGLYTAGATSGVIDTVQVTDFALHSATATVSVQPALTLAPATDTIASGSTHAFTGSGGVAPLTYSVSTDNSGGSIGAGTGQYTAGPTSGVADTVRVTDAEGNTAQSTVTVNPALSLAPATLFRRIGTSATFVASGGVGTYSFGLPANNSGGSVNAGSGLYTAGAVGGVSDTVGVTDSDGKTATASVAVTMEVARQIAAGGAFACVVSHGRVKCWGSNADGQLGDGSLVDSSIPVVVGGVTTATAVAASVRHACALLSSGQIRCWGANDFGQLGDGTTTPSPWPVAVTGIATATSVTAGGMVVQADSHSCALLLDGTARCWGGNGWGELGNGGTTPSSVPVPVTAFAGTAQAISAGCSWVAALLADGRVSCFGSNGYNQCDGAAGVDGGTYLATTPTGEGSCVILADRTVACWGVDDDGELGDGTTGTVKTSPVAVVGVNTAVGIAMEGNEYGGAQGHSCFLLADGTLRCAGDNYDGQLGNGSNTPSSIPVAVTGINTAVDVAAGSASITTTNAVAAAFSCALLSDGTVKCWGYGGDGELGNGSTANSSVPVTVAKYTEPVLANGGGAGTPSGSTISVTYPSTVEGNLLVCSVSWSGAGTFSSLSDTAGNAWSIAVGPYSGGTMTSALFYVPNAKPQTGDQVTASWAASVSFPNLTCTQWAGLSNVAPLDQVGTASGTTTVTTAVSTGGSTSVDNELVIAVVNSNYWPTVGAGYTQFGIIGGYETEFLTTDAAGSTQTATWTIADGYDYNALIATFKPDSL